MNVTRRKFIASMGAISITGLAGCSTVTEDVNMTAEPVGLSSTRAEQLNLELKEFIQDIQKQELANPEGEEPVNMKLKLNGLMYSSTIFEELANLAFISTGSHKIVGQEINPIGSLTPKQIVDNVTALGEETTTERVKTVTLNHSEYGDIKAEKFETAVSTTVGTQAIISYGLKETIDDVIIVSVGSYSKNNSDRDTSIRQALKSFKIPTNATEGMKPKPLSDSILSSVTSTEDVDMEELPM